MNEQERRPTVAPKRNKKKRNIDEVLWSAETIAHLVWTELHSLLEDYSQEPCLKDGTREFAKVEAKLIAHTIEEERKKKFPSVSKAVDALVPVAKAFCVKKSPELKLRKRERFLYNY